MTQKTFFTSDIHFGHANAISYCQRPFGTEDERKRWNDKTNPVSAERKAELVAEMDEAMLKAINDTVGPRDFLYILGDVSFAKPEYTKQMIKRMNGIKILVWGNHDQVIRSNSEIRDLFHETHELLDRTFVVDGKRTKIVMCHYAMKVWNKSHHNSIHLFGHSHGTMPDDGSRSMDVGVDAVGMRPISLEEVMVYMEGRTNVPIDHHTEPR